jgi:hypothetical protein
MRACSTSGILPYGKIYEQARGGASLYGSTKRDYFSTAQALKVSVRTADALVSDQEITGVRLRGKLLRMSALCDARPM